MVWIKGWAVRYKNSGVGPKYFGWVLIAGIAFELVAMGNYLEIINLPTVWHLTAMMLFMFSIMTLIVHIIISSLRVDRFDKQVLCYRLKTGNKEYDRLIDTVIRLCKKLERNMTLGYGNIRLIVELNDINEPIVIGNDLGEGKNEYFSSVTLDRFWPTDDPQGMCFLKEYLVKNTKTEADKFKLEKLLFEMA